MEAKHPNRGKVLWVNSLRGRRFVKSHLPLDVLPYDPKLRYIYVARDGRDVLWSRHAQNLAGRRHRGEPEPADLDEDACRFFRDWLETDLHSPLSYFGHIRSWWRFRRLPNICIVHYAELKADLPGQMTRLADFLGIRIHPELWSETVRRCTFEHMKAQSTSILSAYEAQAPGAPKVFMNKGEVGRWRNVLPAADVAAYESMAVRELGEACAAWLAQEGRAR
jgi:aryl sulfotransferase